MQQHNEKIENEWRSARLAMERFRQLPREIGELHSVVWNTQGGISFHGR